MSRDGTPYATRREWKAPEGYGIDASEPVAGFYRYRLRSDGVRGGVKIWYGPPFDPVTGEELDRSWRFQASFNGQPVDLERVWPNCAGDPITEADYRRYVARLQWAEQHAPESAYADGRKRHDPLSPDAPLPF